MRRTKFYGGLFCITMATLMLQILQTRILSVVVWYFLAFYAISCAMFGLTVGAVWVYLRKERFSERTLSYDLTAFSAAFAVSVVVALAVQMTLSPIIAPSATAAMSWLELVICLSVPFVFSGIVVSLALTRSPFPVGLVYGVDLVGAAVGCIGVLAVLEVTGDGPTSVLWTGAIAALGALLFAGSDIGGRPQIPHRFLSSLHDGRWGVFAVIILVALANQFDPGRFGIRPIFVKHWVELLSKAPLYEKWNSFSRIAVYDKDTREPIMWGPSPTYDPAPWLIDQRHVNIDGSSATFAYNLKGDIAKGGFLKFDVTNLAYYLPNRTSALIIGVGAGRDMASARLFGVPEVTGVEINPILVSLQISEPGFAEYTGLGGLKGFRFVNDEARSWTARSRSRFDVIQMSLIDTLAATGAGAFSLTENGLYTVEAWLTFLRHLTPGGVFTVSRWFNPSYLEETGRMVSVTMAALMEDGATRPDRHIFLATSGWISTLILSRDPLSPAAIDALERAAELLSYKVEISPGRPIHSKILRAFVSATTRAGLNDLTRGLPIDLSPSTDDRPFFFNMLRALDLPSVIAVARSGRGPGLISGNLIATLTLFLLFFLSLILVALSIVYPLRHAVQDVGARLARAGTAYFALIGIGFMAAEVAFLQRFSVILGHPTYALSVVLFSMILSAGAGSAMSDRLRLLRPAAFTVWAALTGGYLVLLPLWLPALAQGYAGDGLLVRALACVLTIMPAGFLLGFGFPTGMRLISAVNANPTPWYWGINGAAGVMASSLAVATSISFGISATLALAGVCYLLLPPVALAIGFPDAELPSGN